MIRHIVMWKFREGEEENREKFLSGLQALDGVCLLYTSPSPRD